MYTQLDSEAPAAALAALAEAIRSPVPVFLIIDEDTATLADADGIREEYADEGDEVAEAIARSAESDEGEYCDAAMIVQADPAEAIRWIAVWLDPELA